MRSGQQTSEHDDLDSCLRAGLLFHVRLAERLLALCSCSMSATKLRVVELDLLRFIAALAVVFYHYTYHLQAGSSDAFPRIGRIAMHGYLGVDLFFMISGFVILWTARDRRPSQFVVSRVARLYPEFWLSVLLSAIAFAATDFRPITLALVAANLTMVPSYLGQEYVDVVYWTLSVELKFYALLWALIIARQMPRVEAWLYAWLAAALVCFTTAVPHVAQSVTLHPFSPLFIAGGLFYLVRAEGITWSRAIGILVCLILATTHVVDQMPSFVQPGNITTATALETRLVIVSCFAALAFISMRRGSWVPFGSAIAFLGMLTYPLYLLHNIGRVVILWPLAKLDPNLALGCALAFSLAISSAMVLLVERRLRRPFADRLTRLLVSVPRDTAMPQA